MRMHTVRRWGGVLGAMLLMAGNALAAPIPEVLDPWREWVLHGREDELCPARAGGEEAACGFPGELRIEADESGARFTQRWTVYSRQAVPLPGDGGDFAPIDVTV